MFVTAKLSYLKIAPRKVRLVVDLIRGKSVEEAQAILRFTVKKGAEPLLKLLKSATSNAKNNFQLEESNLYISKILVNEGPKLKRWMPRARGQAYEIQKKTSHIILTLDEIVKKTEKREKGKKKEKIIKSTIKTALKSKKIQKKDLPDEDKFSGKQAKFKPATEIERPKFERGIKRIFKRKSF